MNVTPHFSRRELNYDAAPAGVRANLVRLAEFLEDVRSVLGVPLRVTSAYRTPDRNASLAGASSTSQHLDGTAADVVPVGMDVPAAVAKLTAAGLRDRWGQLIVYPYRGHIHLSLPTRGTVGAMLAQVSPDAARPRYVPYTATGYVALAGDAAARRQVGGLSVAVVGATIGLTSLKG